MPSTKHQTSKDPSILFFIGYIGTTYQESRFSFNCLIPRIQLKIVAVVAIKFQDLFRYVHTSVITVDWNWIKMAMRYQYTIESRAEHARINGCEDVRWNVNKAGCCRLVDEVCHLDLHMV